MADIHLHGNEIHQGSIRYRGHIMPGVDGVVPSVPGIAGPIPFFQGSPNGREHRGFFSPGVQNPLASFSTIGRYDRHYTDTGVYGTTISRYVRRG
jgi:hypothetical protein